MEKTNQNEEREGVLGLIDKMPLSYFKKLPETEQRAILTWGARDKWVKTEDSEKRREYYKKFQTRLNRERELVSEIIFNTEHAGSYTTMVYDEEANKFERKEMFFLSTVNRTEPNRIREQDLIILSSAKSCKAAIVLGEIEKINDKGYPELESFTSSYNEKIKIHWNDFKYVVALERREEDLNKPWLIEEKGLRPVIGNSKEFFLAMPMHITDQHTQVFAYLYPELKAKTDIFPRDKNSLYAIGGGRIHYDHKNESPLDVFVPGVFSSEHSANEFSGAYGIPVTIRNEVDGYDHVSEYAQKPRYAKKPTGLFMAFKEKLAAKYEESKQRSHLELEGIIENSQTIKTRQ